MQRIKHVLFTFVRDYQLSISALIAMMAMQLLFAVPVSAADPHAMFVKFKNDAADLVFNNLGPVLVILGVFSFWLFHQSKRVILGTLGGMAVGLVLIVFGDNIGDYLNELRKVGGTTAGTPS